MKLNDKLQLKNNEILTLQGRLENMELLTHKPPKIKYEVEYRYRSRCNTCKVDDIQEELNYTESIASFFIIYAITTAIIATIKNIPLRTDIRKGCTTLWSIVKAIASLVYRMATEASHIAYKISNSIVSNIFHWVILILVILVTTALISACFYFIVSSVKALFEAKWDTIQTIITVIIAGTVIYLSDVINPKIYGNISLVLIFLSAILVSIVVRAIKCIKE